MHHVVGYATRIWYGVAAHGRFWVAGARSLTAFAPSQRRSCSANTGPSTSLTLTLSLFTVMRTSASRGRTAGITPWTPALAYVFQPGR